MRNARLIVVYVLVECPVCAERLTQTVGRETPINVGPRVWHVSRLEAPLFLTCPNCETEVRAGGENAFAMPRDTYRPPKEEKPSQRGGKRSKNP